MEMKRGKTERKISRSAGTAAGACGIPHGNTPADRDYDF
jgi:hypothetical protein